MDGVLVGSILGEADGAMVGRTVGNGFGTAEIKV